MGVLFEKNYSLSKVDFSSCKRQNQILKQTFFKELKVQKSRGGETSRLHNFASPSGMKLEEPEPKSFRGD